MLLTPLAIIAGLAVGMARGGKPENLRTMALRWVPLLIVGLILQTIGDQFSWGGGAVVLMIGSFLLITALGRNLHLKGMTIVSIGLLLNLTVLVFNGHIPTRFSALDKAGQIHEGVVASDIAGIGQVGQLETLDTTLPILGDIIPIPLVNEVISFGDLIMIAGLFVLFMNLLLLPRRTGVSIDEILDDEAIPPAGTPTSGEPSSVIDLTTEGVAAPMPPAPTELDLLGLDTGDPASLDDIAEGQLGSVEGVKILPAKPKLGLTTGPKQAESVSLDSSV